MNRICDILLLGIIWFACLLATLADYPPTLLGYTFDLGLGNLTLTFDSLVNVGTFDIHGLTLNYSTVSNHGLQHAFHLTQVYNKLQLQKNSTKVSILLSSNDYARFKYTSNIDNTKSDLLLSIKNGTVKSANGTDCFETHNPIRLYHKDIFPDKTTPFLDYFAFNVNTSNLSLTFTEPMNFNTFTVVGLALQGSRNMKIAQPHYDQYWELSPDEVSILGYRNYGRTIDVNLGPFNMNNIKALIGLCKTRDRCYLSAYKPFINDTAGNIISLVAFDKVHGAYTKEYMRDLSSPSILSWDYNCNNGWVHLMFSETVYLDFFNYSKVILYNGHNYTLRVENPMNRSTDYSPSVFFNLNLHQFQQIQNLDILTNVHNSYLILEPNVVVDTSDDQNPYFGEQGIATEDRPMQVTTLVPDVTKPELTSWTLDLINSLLILQFSKSIRFRSFRPQYIILQSDANTIIGTEMIIINPRTDIILLTDEDGTEIAMGLTESFLQKLRLFFYLGKSKENTFLAADYHLLTDRSPQRNALKDIETSSALQVQDLTPDASEPVLLAWEMNLKDNFIELNFSKPIELNTLDLSTGFIASDEVLIPSTKTISLNDLVIFYPGHESSHTMTKAVNLKLIIPTLLQTEFKNNLQFCTKPSKNCLLTFSNSFVSSLQSITNGQALYAPVSAVNSLPPTVFVRDSLPIVLHSYSTNFQTRQLFLNFSKPILLSNVTLSKFNLSNVILSDFSIVSSVNGGISTSRDDSLIESNVVITLTQQTMYQLEYVARLATTLGSTYLSIASGGVVDVFGNTNSPQQHLHPIRYQADLNSPKLLAIYLEPIKKLNLTLYFNKLVSFNQHINISQFYLVFPTGVVYSLQDAKLVNMTKYHLTAQHSIDLPGAHNHLHIDDSSQLIVDLSPIATDLWDEGLAQGQSSTALIIRNGANVVDSTYPTGIPLVGMSINNVIRDGLTLLSFRLNMFHRQIALEMSFPMDIQSIIPSQISLFSLTTRYALTSLDSFDVIMPTPNNGAMLILTFSQEDYDSIQKRFDLSNPSKLKINILPTAIIDIHNKELSSIVTLLCSSIIQDRRQPQLLSYAIDLNIGQITMNFSKIITKSSYHPDTYSNMAIATIDQTHIHNISEFLFLTGVTLWTNPTATNNNNNRNNKQFYDYTLLLDLNKLPITKYIEKNGYIDIRNEDNYPLTCRENILLHYPLLYIPNKSYLFLQKGFIYDNILPSVPSKEISFANNFIPSNVIYDNQPPDLVNFILDLNERLLILNFTEAVNTQFTRVDYITFGKSAKKPTVNYTLSSTSKVINQYEANRLVKIQISSYDMNQMMLFAPHLIISQNISYLSILANAVMDLAHPPNGNLDILFRYPILPSEFVPDMQPPTILAYNISLKNGYLDILFNEVVFCQSIIMNQLIFQSKNYLGSEVDPITSVLSPHGVDNTMESHENSNEDFIRLSDESFCFAMPYSYQVRIVLSHHDMNKIRNAPTLLKSKETSFLRMEANTVEDVFHNWNYEIPDGSCLTPTFYISDQNRPRLLAFSLNHGEQLTFFFNKPVNPTSMSLRDNVFFQDHQNINFNPFTLKKQYPLKNAYFLSTANEQYEVTIQLVDDYIRMAGNSYVFRAQFNTFINFDRDFIADTQGNPIVIIPQNDSLMIGPSIFFWDLNMNDNTILLVFTEPVEVFSSLTGITIHNHNNGRFVDLSTSYLPGSGSLCVSNEMNQTYLCQLDGNDINNLKLSGLLNQYAIYNQEALSKFYQIKNEWKNNTFYYLRDYFNDINQQTQKLNYYYPIVLSVTGNFTHSSNPMNMLSRLQSIPLSYTKGYALELRNYYPDITAPICSSFNLNLNAGYLELNMNEPVLLSAVKLEGIILFSAIDGSFHRLSSLQDDPDNVLSLHSSTILHIQLSYDDLASIKVAFQQGIILNRLVIEANSIYDYSNNAIGNEYDANHPIPIHVLVNDTSPPQLLSYKIDLSTYVFTLEFDEIIDFTSLKVNNMYLLATGNISDITFLENHPQQQIPSSHPLRGNSLFSSTVNYLQLSNYTLLSPLINEKKRFIAVDFSFLRYDQFQMELMPQLFNAWASSFIAITNVADVFGNAIVPASPLVFQATSVIAKQSPVILESFDISLPPGNAKAFLTFFYSNIIDLTTFDCTDYLFQTDRALTNSSDTLSFTTAQCTLTSSENQRYVTMTVASSLFSSTMIGNDIDQSYLSVNKIGKIRDIYNNTLLPIPSNKALIMGPRVLKASLDMLHGVIWLIFSNPMDLSSMTSISEIGFITSLDKYTQMTYDLQDSTLHAYSTWINTQSYYFMKNPSIHVNESVGVIVLSEDDFNGLKSISVSPTHSSFLIHSRGWLVDEVAGLPLAAIGIRDEFIIDRFIPDTIPPEILTTTLDMGEETLTIVFTEPIDSNSIDLTKFSFQSVRILHENIGATNYYRLTTARSITFPTLTTMVIHLSLLDMKNLKLNSFIAKSQATSYLGIEFGALSDMYHNYLPAIPIYATKRIDNYIPDIISPSIMSFTLNLNLLRPLLFLYFSEPVDVSTLDLTQITFQSRFASQDGVKYQITGGQLLSGNDNVLVIELLESDLINMKLIDGLIRRKQSTYMVTTIALVTDLAGNGLVPNADGHAILCSKYTANTMPSEIIWSSLNMNTGLLQFAFNAPVALKSINVTALTMIAETPSMIVTQIQNNNVTSLNELYQLVPAFTFTRSTRLIVNDPSQLYSMNIAFQISHMDLNAIKSLYPLASARNHVNFIYSTRFLTDWNKLLITPITIPENYHPVPLTEYLPDTIRPTVLSYNLDMDLGLLTLFFSETINPARMKLQQLIIQNTPTRKYGAFISFQNASSSVGSLDEADRLTVTIPVHPTLTFMKYQEIGYQYVSTYLTWNNSFIEDYGGNQVIPVWDASVVGFDPIEPLSLVPDQTPPELLRWYLNRQTMELFMYFDEPIYLQQLSEIFLINSYRSPSYLYAISSNSSFSYEEQNQKLIIQLVNYCQFGSLETIVSITGVVSEQCSNGILPFYQFLNNTLINPLNSTLSLVLGNFSITDASIKKNSIVIPPALMRKEGSPDCSACPSGTFVEKICTLSADRVCTKCSSCYDQYYEKVSCTPYRDTSCAACSACPFGSYAQSPCTTTSDTVCVPCDSCGKMEYPSRQCVLGLNTICESCEQCSFLHPVGEKMCKQNYGRDYEKWSKGNCCVNSAGKKVLCSELKPHSKDRKFNKLQDIPVENPPTDRAFNIRVAS